MFHPATCIYEVATLAKHMRTHGYPQCDYGVAFSAFFSDVKQGTAHEENTYGLFPDFDFASASAAWNAMTDDEQTKALEEARRSRTALAAQLEALYPDKAAMVKLVEDYLSAPTEAPEAE